MKKIFFLAAFIVLITSLLSAKVLRVAIIDFERSDRESDYVVNSLMKRDFKNVFDDFEDLELIKIKDSQQVFEKSGYADPSYMGTEDIAKLGIELDADIVIWGNVAALSNTDFKILTKIFSMKSKDVVAITFEVKKDTEQRRQVLKDELIAKIKEFSGGEIEKLLGIAIQHFNSKNYASAEETFYDLLEIDPENLEANFYIGLINYINKDYDKSEEHYLKALELDPENYDVLDYLSQTYLKQGKYDEAIAALTKIAENNEDKEIWFKIGNIYLDNDYTDEAEQAFLNALDIDPEYLEAQIGMGEMFYGMEYFEEAIPYLEFAVKENPDDEDLQKKLAFCYKKTGQIDNAIAQYQAIIDEQPDNFRAYVNLANAYNIKEMYRQALDTSFKLKEIAPDDPRVYILISNGYMSLNNFTNAEQNALSAINMDANLYQPYRILLEIYQKRGYSRYEAYLDLEERARNAYGKEADELVEQRDREKDGAHALFLKSQEYLNQARARTDNRSELNYLDSTQATLSQLLDATKKDFF